MNAKGRSYWAEQAKARMRANAQRSDDYTAELLGLYQDSAAKVEAGVNTLFARYAVDNELTYAEASRLLAGKEYSTWRKSMEGYLAECSGAAKGSKAYLELNTLAAKSRISRQEQLLANIYRDMIDLAGDSAVKLEDLLGDMYKVNYLESCWRLQRGIGMGFSVAKVNRTALREVLAHRWSERTFSEAVWGQCDHLAALAKREITMGLIQGSSVQQMARNINAVMDKGMMAAERLVRTECKYFANQGELQGYREHGVKRYRFVGGSEGSSSSCGCADLNGQTFPIEEAVAGINYPPIHPNCLCIVVADFEERELLWLKKADPLQENIKFQEWAKKYGGTA